MFFFTLKLALFALRSYYIHDIVCFISFFLRTSRQNAEVYTERRRGRLINQQKMTPDTRADIPGYLGKNKKSATNVGQVLLLEQLYSCQGSHDLYYVI